MAPEMLTAQNSINFSKLDIFSVGLISLFCLDNQGFLKQSNLNKDNLKLLDFLRTLRYNYPRKKSKVGLSPDEIPRGKIPLDFYYMLRSMLSSDNDTRPSIEEIYKDASKILAEHEVQ
jgi:hypothetical protein